MNGVVIIEWRRYPDFFELYKNESAKPKLIYIIGETHHCYVGSVGSRGGNGGLAVRYLKQYIDRAKAIFGQDKPQNQPAFAGFFVSEVDEKQINAVEAEIQNAFINRYGKDTILFVQKSLNERIEMQHKGELPNFLKFNGPKM